MPEKCGTTVFILVTIYEFCAAMKLLEENPQKKLGRMTTAIYSFLCFTNLLWQP